MRRIDTFPTHKIGELSYRAGQVFPFGASIVDGGVNFSVYSKDAVGCTLVLFHHSQPKPFAEIPFPDSFRIGNVFTMLVFGLNIETVEYGYRFDLASILTRDETGAPMLAPPLLESLARDPVLGKTKLIAEAWDAGELYQVGSFPSWQRWSEWNGRYRDCVRRFIKGDAWMAAELLQRISGSPDLYAGRQPVSSINLSPAMTDSRCMTWFPIMKNTMTPTGKTTGTAAAIITPGTAAGKEPLKTGKCWISVSAR